MTSANLVIKKRLSDAHATKKDLSIVLVVSLFAMVASPLLLFFVC